MRIKRKQLERMILTPAVPRSLRLLEPDSKHVHNPGWPHLSHQGTCLCFCFRCLQDGGCVCKDCTGIGHTGCDHATILDILPVAR